MKQKLRTERREKSTTVAEDVNISLSVLDTTTRQKTSKLDINAKIHHILHHKTNN